MKGGCEPDSLAAIAGLARELHFRQVKCVWMRPTNLSCYASQLAHFTNVTTLVLTNFVTSVFHAVSLSNYLKPLTTVVRNLRVCHPITRPTSLAHLILLFSSAVNVQILWPRWSITDENTHLPAPLRSECGLTGILHLHGFGERWSEFFILLSAHWLGFRKIRLLGCEFKTSVPTQSLFGAVSQSARDLHLDGPGKRRLD